MNWKSAPSEIFPYWSRKCWWSETSTEQSLPGRQRSPPPPPWVGREFAQLLASVKRESWNLILNDLCTHLFAGSDNGILRQEVFNNVVSNTAPRRTPPPNLIFLPVATPELRNVETRCKILTRRLALPSLWFGPLRVTENFSSLPH